MRWKGSNTQIKLIPQGVQKALSKIELFFSYPLYLSNIYSSSPVNQERIRTAILPKALSTLSLKSSKDSLKPVIDLLYAQVIIPPSTPPPSQA